MEFCTLSDPSRLAQDIRVLAHDAHHALTHSASAESLRRLSRRIDRLSRILEDRREAPFTTWLDNLGREVRSAAAQRARASRRGLCLCA